MISLWYMRVADILKIKCNRKRIAAGLNIVFIHCICFGKASTLMHHKEIILKLQKIHEIAMNYRTFLPLLRE